MALTIAHFPFSSAWMVFFKVLHNTGILLDNQQFLFSWQQSRFVFFMIFKASLLIQVTNIHQLCIDHFVRSPFAIFQSAS